MKFHNRRSRKHLSILTVLILLVSSCVPSAEETEQPVAVATIASSAILPVITNTSAPLPTVENVSTPTTQSNIELLMEQECIPTIENMPSNLVLSGVWVRNRGTPYLETADGLTAYDVPLKGGSLFSTNEGDIAISPDGKHLAYIDAYIDPIRNGTEKRILRIIKSSGHELPMDFWTENWQWIIGWIDDRQLALFTGKREVIILDPFSGEWERPQQPTWLKTTNFYDYSGPFYNPKLNSILVRLEFPDFELRDFETGKTLYNGTGYLDRWNHSWSADGLTLAIASGNSKTDIVTRDKQGLTLDLGGFGIESIFHPKLSPDGHKLVFASYSDNFFLIDIIQSTISTLCPNGFNPTYSYSLLWSPDSRFVIQEVYDSNYDEFDILVDTQEMQAYKLTSGQYQHRLIWLAEP